MSNNKPETTKRLEELFSDVEDLLIAFGGLILLRQSYSTSTLSTSEVREEAKLFVERNRDTIYILLRTQ